MHFNKINNNNNNSKKSNNDSLTSSSLSSSSVVAAGDDSVSPYFTTITISSSASWFHGMNVNLCWLFLLVLLFMAHQQPCECRYLPTRSHADDLDKLRELMLQILESSNEEVQRSPNDGNGNIMAAQRANWLNSLGSQNNMDANRKYNIPRGLYDNGHYY
uniref:Proctolin n=1 Tax=Glossina brevipalpis TaxID=37001 RepID=A0A1A9VZN8_9MUSC